MADKPFKIVDINNLGNNKNSVYGTTPYNNINPYRSRNLQSLYVGQIPQETSYFNCKEWQDYLSVMKNMPQLFKSSECYDIILNEGIIASYCLATKQKVGVVFSNDKIIIINDLVRYRSGRIGIKDRIIPISLNQSIIVIQDSNTKEYIIFNRYSHSTREIKLGFYRTLISVENYESSIKDILNNNLNVTVNTIEVLTWLNSGNELINDAVNIFKCQGDTSRLAICDDSIVDFKRVSLEDMKSKIISGEIRDALTISIYYKLKGEIL